MTSPSWEKVASRHAGKPESSNAAVRIFKDNKGWSKKKSERKRASMGEEERPSR